MKSLHIAVKKHNVKADSSLYLWTRLWWQDVIQLCADTEQLLAKISLLSWQINRCSVQQASGKENNISAVSLLIITTVTNTETWVRRGAHLHFPFCFCVKGYTQELFRRMWKQVGWFFDLKS